MADKEQTKRAFSRAAALSIAGLPAVLLTAALVVSAPVSAQKQGSQDTQDARDARIEALNARIGGYLAQDTSVTLEEARAIATKQHPGRVVRAETKVHEGRNVHEIRVLASEGGDVHIVRVEQSTGKILEDADDSPGQADETAAG